MVKLEISGIVPSKSNTYRMGRGNFYKSEVVSDYESNFRWQTMRVPKNQFDKKANLFVTYDLYVGNMGQDSDNIEKTINDCLQKCEIIPNDNKIIVHHTIKSRDIKNPRVVVTIEELK